MARKQFQNGLPKPQEFTAYIGYSANTKKLPNGAAAYCILDDKGIYDQQCKVFTGKTALELCLIAVWSVMLKMPKDAIVRIICNSTDLIGALSPDHITDTNCSFLKSKIIREKHRIKSWEITKPTSALDQSYYDLVMGWAKKAYVEYETSGTANNQKPEK